MDSFLHHNKPTSTADAGSHDQKRHEQPSNTELLSSAKLVADAASSALRHDTSKIDKAKVAGAAENLLDAASRYGKLDDKAYGKYLDKAEDYLHKYHAGSEGHSAAANTTAGSHAPSGGSHGEHGHSGGGQGEHGHSGGSGGYGDYIKMAQGFLNKE